jgi:pimeloyl-ACP methyl ester carboxylesterase
MRTGRILPVPHSDTAVVLLHGQPATHVSWLPARRLLDDAEVLTDVDVLNPDRPGYGANPAPATDYPGNVDWLIRLLDGAGLRRAVLVGHSWGGGIATLAAVRHPDRVAGLVLVSSVGPRCLLPQDHPLGWPVLGDLLAYAGLNAAGPVLRHRARKELGLRVAPADLDEVEESLRVQFERPVWRSFLLEQRALLEQLPALDAALAAIRVPAIVLTGTEDRVIPADTPRLLSSRIRGAELRVIPRIGHMLPLDAPDIVARAVLDVVGRVSARSPR